MQNSSLMLKKNPRKLSIADLYSCPHDVGKRAQNKQQLMGNLKKQLIALGGNEVIYVVYESVLTLK